MIQALTWSGVHRDNGGGFAACIEWPRHIALPFIDGATIQIDGQDRRILRVVRLFKDTKKRRPSDRIALVVSE